MKFRNKNTGHVLSVSNKACIETMMASPAYEVIVEPKKAPEAPAAETPVAETAEETPKPKATKPKAKK